MNNSLLSMAQAVVVVAILNLARLHNPQEGLAGHARVNSFAKIC